MLWGLILASIAVGLFILAIDKGKADFNFVVGGTAISAVSVLILTITASIGIPYTADLKQELEQIRVYEKGITDIREAYYQERRQHNAIVGGSLTNIQQSKILSEYIGKVIQLKAGYNSKLTLGKLYKQNFWLKWGGYGMFINDKIFGMECLR